MRIEGQGAAEVVYFPAREVQGVAQPPVLETPVQDKERGTPRVGKAEEKMTGEAMEKSVEMANHALKTSNLHVEFRLHQGSGRYAVKVVDSDTQEVIREIPPERMLDLSARIKEMVEKELGLLIDERV